jgi:tetratricopeptide (TPR) repeat protein
LVLVVTLAACTGPSRSKPSVQEPLPETAQEYFELGYVRLAEDDYPEALRAFSRAIELDPSDARYYRARARVYRVLENKEGALADYSAAIALTEPSELARTGFFQKSLYEQRAVVRRELKQYRDAADDLTRLIELNPKSFPLYVQRAEVYELDGNLGAATEDVTKAIALEPAPFLYAYRARLRAQGGDLDGAIADCTRTLESDPANAACTRQLALWRGKSEPQVAAAQPKRFAASPIETPEPPPPVVKPPGPKTSPQVARPPEARPKAPRAAGAVARAEEPTPQPPPQVAKPTAKTKAGYSIQVATLVLERNAVSLKERLEKLGYSPDVRKTTAPITRHRVTSGEFASREEAEQAARRLQADGFRSSVVEGEDGKFRPEVGSFFRQDDALDLARILEKKNHAAKVISQPAPTPVHQVWVGEYEDQTEALKTLGTLERQGLHPVLVRR